MTSSSLCEGYLLARAWSEIGDGSHLSSIEMVALAREVGAIWVERGVDGIVDLDDVRVLFGAQGRWAGHVNMGGGSDREGSDNECVLHDEELC